uniref:23S rRNA (guanosine-2'-O-)-methyltransferase RlmB n=1 Tax=Candidatus Kentrum sp. SD TaxID=2126332 RepID=A0A450YHE7_9GAMM|nr:MAG: 23S rRNA Gm-2251 2'-O-methyltransferase [Candidatus Kentron sp. SD]VFK49204.1 MAG: 23S rRNA Gm-2251 2'-O-methyltransferase [Candidatus Kentron sp. SD]VFK80002.1 MAG: 23S rRNA Gm-2251 2'-O-methyltransferase [Candidatus Kentron sp. SD]
MPKPTKYRDKPRKTKPGERKFVSRGGSGHRHWDAPKAPGFPARESPVDAAESELTYGHHAVQGILSRGASGAKALFFQENRRDPRTEQMLRQAKIHKIPLHPVSRKALDEMTGGMRHQGFALRCANPDPAWRPDHLLHLLENLSGPPLLLVLDGVQDPHNLGACLRSADGAGAHAVVSPRDRAVGLTPAARKVACGAAESIPLIRIVNLARALDELRVAGVQTIGLAAEAKDSLYDVTLTGPLALVLGGEERGLRRLTRENCDRLVRLPMLGATESLNVSVAAGICLYEARRQRERNENTGKL